MGLLTAKDVCARLKCSISTLYRWMDADVFPRPKKFYGMVRWPEEVVDDFIANAKERKGESGHRPASIRRGRPVNSWDSRESHSKKLQKKFDKK